MIINGVKKEYDDLTIEDIDYLMEKEPWDTVRFLFAHPLLNQQHVDIIVKVDPWNATEYLNQHPFFNQQHIDYIIEKVPWKAITHLKHRLSDKNLEYLAINHSKDYEGLFK
jgi:hypothetical protein